MFDFFSNTSLAEHDNVELMLDEQAHHKAHNQDENQQNGRHAQAHRQAHNEAHIRTARVTAHTNKRELFLEKR